jgi:glycosyltransferase involved in cell wall biosynthesis
MIACGLPVVAADVGAMGSLLSNYRDPCLFPPADAQTLAERIAIQLERRRRVEVPVDDWRSLISRIEPKLRQLALTAVTT